MTSSNPLDVEIVVRTSIADILMEKGLALKKDTRSKCARTWNGSSGNSLEDDPVVENEPSCVKKKVSIEQVSSEEVN